MAPPDPGRWSAAGWTIGIRHRQPARTHSPWLVKSALLAGLGALLLYLAVFDFQHRMSWGPNIGPFLALAWSISLFYLAIIGLVRHRQAGRQGRGERPDPCVRGI